jgi:hypothetical protein
MHRISLVCIIALLALSVLGCGSAVATPKTGTWHSTTTPHFVAKVANNKIRITLTIDKETTGLYWQGTFNSSAKTIVSKGDAQAMDESLLGSSDKTKKFTYKDGKLIFAFSAMGISRTVELKQ